MAKTPKSPDANAPEQFSPEAASSAASSSPVPPAIAELSALLGIDPKDLSPEAILDLLKRSMVKKPEPAKEAASVAEAPDRNELVAIFNKNPPGGDFVHHVYEIVKAEDGRVIGQKPKAEFRAVARGFSHVPRWVAALWMKQAPGTIVDAAGVGQRSSSPVAVERVSALEGENSELKTRLANMEKMIAELQKTRV